MINKVNLMGFKRFGFHSFNMEPLTVLAGLNGAGKTSLIHALLLAWEASSSKTQSVVSLNGPFGWELGSAEDIRNWAADGDIRLDIHSSSNSLSKWRFGTPSEKSLYLTLAEYPEVLPFAFSREPRAFSYLSAERLGPRSVLDAQARPNEELEVGIKGEFSAQVLANLGDKPIEDSARLHPDKDSSEASLLKYEVERWLGEIARPVEINAEQYLGTTVTSLRFRSPGGEWVRAPNMGFGVSYALPVILAGLTALRGGLLIIENPEAHLHPAGQSRMGVFLSWLASKGVQVIVETHSDHVLNGIRRAIGEYKYLSKDDAVVHFFESDDSGQPCVHQLEFTEIGGLSNWPKGFFDQYQVDVSSLGRIRRGR